MSDAPIKNKTIKEEDFDQFYVSTIMAEYDNPDNTDFVALFISYDFFMGEAFFVIRSLKDGVKKENAIGSLFDEYLEDGNNEENKNNNIENPAENNLQFMRASTMFQDILDFNQEYQEINNNIIKDLNAKTKKQKKK